MKNQTCDLDDEKCAVCKGLPEDILMLECSHDICVDCALKAYRKGKSQGDMFVCSLCRRKTVLDRQTVEFLQAAMEQKRAEAQEKYQRPPPVPKAPKHKDKRICIQHKEELIYYCLDCDTQDICAECMLSPKHANHNVCTLKKAIQRHRTTIINELKEKETNRFNLENYQKTLEELQVSFRNQVETRRKEIKFCFEGLSRIVQNNYERVNKQLEEAVCQSQNALLAQIRRNTDNINQLGLEMEQLRKIASSDNPILTQYKKPEPRLITEPIKLQGILPEFEHCDISLDLNKRLSVFNVVRQTSSTSQTRHLVEQFHQGSYYPNQTRIKMSGYSQAGSGFKGISVQTPLKSQMKRSINTASDLINRLQSRQRSFD